MLHGLIALSYLARNAVLTQKNKDRERTTTKTRNERGRERRKGKKENRV